jgi:hypothetical protein
MRSPAVAIGLHGALVCGLTAEGKAWIKDYFSPEVSVAAEPYGPTGEAPQRTIGALSEVGLACLIDSA